MTHHARHCDAPNTQSMPLRGGCLCSAFLDSVAGKGGYPIGGSEARKAVEVVCAIYAAAASGSTVKIGGD